MAKAKPFDPVGDALAAAARKGPAHFAKLQTALDALDALDAHKARVAARSGPGPIFARLIAAGRPVTIIGARETVRFNQGDVGREIMVRRDARLERAA